MGRVKQLLTPSMIERLEDEAMVNDDPPTRGWQPIETAPKGRDKHILVAKPGHSAVRAWFEDGTWWPHLAGPLSNMPTPLEGRNHPTHWQPLPEPPHEQLCPCAPCRAHRDAVGKHEPENDE